MSEYSEFSDAYREFWGSDRGLEPSFRMYENIQHDYVGLSDRSEKARAEDFIAAMDYSSTSGETYNAFQDYFDMYGGSMDDIDWDDFREWYDELFG